MTKQPTVVPQEKLEPLHCVVVGDCFASVADSHSSVLLFLRDFCNELNCAVINKKENKKEHKENA